jgi:hypothetical protein
MQQLVAMMTPTEAAARDEVARTPEQPEALEGPEQADQDAGEAPGTSPGGESQPAEAGRLAQPAEAGRLAQPASATPPRKGPGGALLVPLLLAATAAIGALFIRRLGGSKASRRAPRRGAARKAAPAPPAPEPDPVDPDTMDLLVWAPSEPPATSAAATSAAHSAQPLAGTALVVSEDLDVAGAPSSLGWGRAVIAPEAACSCPALTKLQVRCGVRRGPSPRGGRSPSRGGGAYRPAGRLYRSPDATTTLCPRPTRDAGPAVELRSWGLRLIRRWPARCCWARPRAARGRWGWTC